ncbi:conserved oligomeric Golgi complex subunit 2-like [Diaphorina citri]|uniref:Conserved oligomeric Golgi complex subunit 2 n=1 Tax=Diaphorina citri TaxID=121845 RepID=A0A3Q0IQU8_DIACI|nr:conserved oligomeric Golgi complex subunit 2-like [Diaphorina citri]
MMIPNSAPGDFVLPKCPQELCFNADEFIKESFSVDQFLQDHRRNANLEIMRDDLGIYLKTLRSAMIELINKDYTEFISLSTNLIDLDKRLDNIQSPIGQLSGHIRQTHGKLANTIEEMNVYIKYTGNFKLLSEITFIQFHINACKDKPEFEKISSNWESLKQCLLTKIQNLLLRVYNNRESSKVSCFIIALVNLTDVTHVEKLINKEILAPLFDELINEESLASDPRSLEGLFARVLSHVDSFKQIFGAIEIDSFNLLVNCMIPQVLKRFTLYVKSIFAPGNADMFHRRYKESTQFLDQLEDRCNDWQSVKKVRDCEEYKQFINSWNVTVYFQLRFQNIAGKVETSLAILPGSDFKVDKNKPCKLAAVKQTWECIEMCWSDQVFLPPIVRRLWKLTLQIISRFCTFCDETMKDDWPKTDVNIQKTLFLVCLNNDIQWLRSKLSSLVDVVSQKIILSEQKRKCLQDSLEESLVVLSGKVTLIEEKIIDHVAKESLAHIRSVNDIPRHFRLLNLNTTEEMIKRYVSLLIAPPLKFMNDFPGSKEWLLQIFSKITKEYFNSVREVITSVQRTEESLRRFKKIREKSGGDNSKSGGVGDEEKIKQQISLDVEHYRTVVQKTGLNINDVDSLSELVQIVERSLSKQTEE